MLTRGDVHVPVWDCTWGFDGAGGVGGALSGSWRGLRGEICADGKGKMDGRQLLW